MSRVPTNGIDYTSKDYEAFRSTMLEQLGVKMPEYTDMRQSDAGIVILELLAQGLDVLSLYQDVLANEVFLVTEEQRNNALKWCQMLNYVPKSSTPAKFKQVFILSSPQDEDTLIPAGTRVKTKGTTVEPSVYFETSTDLVIPAGKLGDEQENGEYLYSVEVVHGVSVNSEVLGSSTGTPDQSFTLNYTPVIRDSVEVIVNEGYGFERWRRVSNFIDSSPTDKDYTVTINDNDEAIVTFGDGVFGKIPYPFNGGIYCSYRVGGGTQGNVGASKITIIDTNIATVDKTFNPDTAFEEGQDKETLAEIKRNAPASNRTVWGALTVQDFADVVKVNFLEVDKVASYASGRDINLYILLKNNAPISQRLIDGINSMFDENEGGRKLIGAGNVTCHPATIVPIDLTATLLVKNRFSFDSVKRDIEAFLTDYFAVGNYDFDTELSLSELSSKVMSVENAIEGIRAFRITSPTEEILVPAPGCLFTLGSLTIINGGA